VEVVVNNSWNYCSLLDNLVSHSRPGSSNKVPVTTSIKMTENWTLHLPFGISRWWDVLIGPIWSIVLISLFTNERITKDKDLGVGLVFGLFVLIKWVCSKSFWRTIGNWLLARNAKAEKV